MDMLTFLTGLPMFVQIFGALILLIGMPNIVNFISWIKKRKKSRRCNYTQIKNDRFEAQMSASDKTLEMIKKTMLENYRKYNTNNRDYRAYSNILHITLNMTKEIKLYRYIKNNHFAEKDDSEWKVYKKSTIESLQSYHILKLDDMYNDGDFELSRDKLKKYNDPIMNDIRELLDDMFDEIRDIAVDYEKILRNIE